VLSVPHSVSQTAGVIIILIIIIIDVVVTAEYIPVFSSSTVTDYFGSKYGPLSKSSDSETPSTGAARF
jgi:hypothetical protein